MSGAINSPELDDLGLCVEIAAPGLGYMVTTVGAMSPEHRRQLVARAEASDALDPGAKQFVRNLAALIAITNGDDQ